MNKAICIKTEKGVFCISCAEKNYDEIKFTYENLIMSENADPHKTYICSICGKKLS